MKTVKQIVETLLSEGADIYCPNCGENHGKASEYGRPKVTFCGTCGYSEKKPAPAEKTVAYHLHQGIGTEDSAKRISDSARSSGASNIKISSYKKPSPVSLRNTVTNWSVTYHHTKPVTQDYYAGASKIK